MKKERETLETGDFISFNGAGEGVKFKCYVLIEGQ